MGDRDPRPDGGLPSSWPRSLRQLGRLLTLLALTAACSSPGPSPDADAPAIPEPGRPFDSATILEAMRESRRPGGVPDQLETDAIAAALAERLWTIDGAPWETMSISASCGPVRCTLDVSGSRAGSLGDDLYAFEIIPAGDEVAPISTDLRSMPPDVGAALDGMAREAEARIARDGLVLASARWNLPPEHASFQLSYRSGNEEGSCELELALDAASGQSETLSADGC